MEAYAELGSLALDDAGLKLSDVDALMSGHVDLGGTASAGAMVAPP